MGGSWTPPICPDIKIKNNDIPSRRDHLDFPFPRHRRWVKWHCIVVAAGIAGWVKKKNNRIHSMADPSRYEKNIHLAVGNRTGICKYLPATMFVFPWKKVKQIGGLLSTIIKTLAQCLKKTALYSCEIYFLWTILKMNLGMKKKR